MSWNKISAIGTWLGAIATFSAVMVALYQTKLSNKKKLKLKINDFVTIMSTNYSLQRDSYIGITIVNTGNRKVIIDDWSIVSDKRTKRRYKIITELQGELSEGLPHVLNVEEKLNLHYLQEHFLTLIRKLVDKNELNLNDNIIFQVLDSTHKAYFVKSKKTVSQYLEGEE